MRSAEATNTEHTKALLQLPEEPRQFDSGEDSEFESEDENPPTAPSNYELIRQIVHWYRKIYYLNSMSSVRPILFGARLHKQRNNRKQQNSAGG